MKIAKFLLCTNTRVDKRVFVLHTRYPKFLAEAKSASAGGTDIEVIEWYDAVQEDELQRIPALMRAMGDWYKGAKNHE